MPFSNWRYHSEIRGALIGFFGLIAIAAAAWFVWKFWPDPPPSYAPVNLGSEAEYLAKVLDDDCRTLLAAKPVSDPNPKQTEDCADKAAAQKYNYASIEQAVRAAQAASYSAYIGYVQTCIGIIGALLVTATLIASAGATFAAVAAARGTIDAAQATRDSVDLARQEFSLTHRPRLRVRKVLIPPLVEGEPIAIQAEIVNVGNTTAILRLVAFRVETRPRTLGAAARWAESDNIGAASTRHNKDGKPVILMCFIRPGGTYVQRLTTNLRYRREAGCPPELMIVRGDIAYDDTFLGSPFDVRARMDFKPTERKTAFERFFARHERSGVIWFAKAKEPDPEFEYED